MPRSRSQRVPESEPWDIAQIQSGTSGARGKKESSAAGLAWEQKTTQLVRRVLNGDIGDT